MTSDGVPITFHAIMVLKVTDSWSSSRTSGPEWVSQQPGSSRSRPWSRQAVRKRGMNETAISTVALDEIDREINDQLMAFMKQKSLPVELVTMTVGRANPPDSVKNQRIETATQEQRIQTEKQKKLAEDPAPDGRDQPRQRRQRVSPGDWACPRSSTCSSSASRWSSAGVRGGQVHVHRERGRGAGVRREVIEPPPTHSGARFRLTSPSTPRSHDGVTAGSVTATAQTMPH